MISNKVYDVRDCKIFYKDKRRVIKCPCNEIVERSIIPHFKKVHPISWRHHVDEFARLTNEGLSPKSIINKFKDRNGKLIFTWGIVENEIKRRVANGQIPIRPLRNVERWEPSNEEMSTVNGTVWDFKKRGAWASHSGDYRGNWPPQVPRIIISAYTKAGDLILDPFVGSGTTLIEAWLLGRKSIGIDINPLAVKLSQSKLDLLETESQKMKKPMLSVRKKPTVILGDASKLKELLIEQKIRGRPFDLIITHPPYFNSLRYTYDNPNDLSNSKRLEEFVSKLEKVLLQSTSYLKPNGYIAIMVGDVRKRGEIIPLASITYNIMKKQRCRLIEQIIKIQHNDRSTAFYSSSSPPYDGTRYLIRHEYILLFQKDK